MNLRAGTRRWLYRILFCILISFRYFDCFKINAPSVLLPYNKGLPSNYTLEITESREDECFEWKSENPQIVRVTPVFSNSLTNCSKKAVLSSISLFFERRVTRVFAVLLGGDKSLLCDIFTDNITSVELQSLSNELKLGGPPQEITVIAKNKHGHTFSSINGMQIDWKVVHHLDSSYEAPTSEDRVIRFSRFISSDYGAADKKNEFERRGMLSTSVLVEPLQYGNAVISASILFSSVPVLHTEEITLKVIPDLKIPPMNTLFLIPHAIVAVPLKNPKDEEQTEDDFHVVNKSPTLSTRLQPYDFSTLYAKDLGISKLTYLSKNYPTVELSVNVFQPYHIGFRISSGDYKTLEEMKIYEVYIDVYDQHHNWCICPIDNLRLNVKFPPKLFHVIYTSDNGSYAVVQTIAPGSGPIRANLKGLVQEDGSILSKYNAFGYCPVTVAQKLRIFPPFTLLPVPQELPVEIRLDVAGGTGEYVWSLSNNTGVKVIHLENNEKNSQLFLNVYEEVDIIVTASDVNNVNFFTTAKVSVQTPLDIEAYPSVVEAEVGNVLIVPTALLGYEDKDKNIIRKFDDCSKTDIKVDIVEKYVLSYEKEADYPAFGKGCKSSQFRCKMPGYSRVNMEYSLPLKNVTFKTTTILSCFKELKPVHPVRVAVLALGTSMEIAFEGGPRKWPLFKEGHYTNLEASNPDIVKIQLIKDPVRYNKDLTVFRVLCKDMGENTLTLKIGNQPSATIQHPAKSEASIKLFCAEPHSVHLKLYRKKSSKQLKDETIVKVPFYGEKIFSIDIFLKDSMGRKFANISSLRVTWDVSDKALANPVSDFDFVTHENAVSGYRKLTRNFRDFQMTGSAGELKVKAKVLSYRKDVFKVEGITEYKEIDEISRSLDLKLVSLRDINEDQYASSEDKQDENGHCESDSCES